MTFPFLSLLARVLYMLSRRTCRQANKLLQSGLSVHVCYVLSAVMTVVLTVDASRCSLPPLPAAVLLGLLESFECFGLRLSTVLVLALPMMQPMPNLRTSDSDRQTDQH